MITAEDLRALFGAITVTFTGPEVVDVLDPETGEWYESGVIAAEAALGGEIFGMNLTCSADMARHPATNQVFLGRLQRMAEMSLRHSIAEKLGLTIKVGP